MLFVVNLTFSDKLSRVHVSADTIGWLDDVQPEVAAAYHLHYHLMRKFVEWKYIIDAARSLLQGPNLMLGI